MHQQHQRISKLKVTALILVIAGAFIAYERFSQPVLAVDNLSATTPTSLGGSNLLSIVNKIKSIKLDGALFSDPAFKSLSDFSVVVQPQPVGRVNPFAPIGGWVAPAKARSR